MEQIQQLMDQIVAFSDEREWSQFHNSKDLALAISIEAAELLELFLWKNAEHVDVQLLQDELADIFCFCFLMAHKHKLDVAGIVEEKIKKNALKYPVEKAKGSAVKYTNL